MKVSTYRKPPLEVRRMKRRQRIQRFADQLRPYSRVATFVIFVIAILLPPVVGPMILGQSSQPAMTDVRSIAHQVSSPATPSIMPVVDASTQNPQQALTQAPVQPRVRYNAYNVAGSGNWNTSVSEHTLEAGRAGVEANMNDPLWVANMEALRDLGTRPTLRPDKDAVYARAEMLWSNPDELTAAATVLQSQIVFMEIASGDQPFWAQIVATRNGDAERPNIDNIRVDAPQGTYFVVKFDNGRIQKLRFETGMGPIIGIKPPPDPVVQPAANNGGQSVPSNVAYDPVWDRLAECEASGNWSINTGNDYYGGLQFGLPTWSDFGGLDFASMPHLATKFEQIIVATRTQAQQGWNAWPSCTRRLGITAPPGPAPSLEPAPAPSAPAPQPEIQNVAHVTEAPPASAGGSVGERALAHAITQDDKLYTLGAEGPNEWDCSSLLQWAFAREGVNIPRTSREQSRMDRGTRINNPDDLRVGDLVFYNSPVSHVSIYAGDGMVFRASTDKNKAPKDQIGFGRLSREAFVWGIRL